MPLPLRFDLQFCVIKVSKAAASDLCLQETPADVQTHIPVPAPEPWEVKGEVSPGSPSAL